MEAVLHIEPIRRQTPPHHSIGHTSVVTYGETADEEEESLGVAAAMMQLGCPLEDIGYGSKNSHIPLVKTFGYIPDMSRSSGNIYTETIHYLKDRKYLIPVRSKIRTGLGRGLKLVHYPSLNFVRSTVAGSHHSVVNPIPEMISQLTQCDKNFTRRHNHHLKDWITEEFLPKITAQPLGEMTFDPHSLVLAGQRYSEQVGSLPTDFGVHNLRDIHRLFVPEKTMIPPIFTSEKPIQQDLKKVKDRYTPTMIDFTSFGRIPVEQINNLTYNPLIFQGVCEAIDSIPLTDFNVDVVISPDGDIEFYHQHIAADRLGMFIDNDSHLYSAEVILEDYLDVMLLADIVSNFLALNRGQSSELEDIFSYHPVKIKIIKTSTDEAAIIAYRYNSTEKEPALCGVYFDIALQTLSPISILREPVVT